MATFVDSSGLMPEPIKRAIEHFDESHVRTGDISVTELIDSPYMFYMKKQYAGSVQVEYSDRLFMLYGSMMAILLERFGGELAEVRAKWTDPLSGLTLSGACDLALDKGDLVDYKFSSVFVASDEESEIIKKYEMQMNLYVFLLRVSKHAVSEHIKGVRIAMPLRDWGPRYKDRFPCGIHSIRCRLWSHEETQKYIQDRMKLFESLIKYNTEPEPCSDKEKWKRDYAVMKQGRKNALKAGFATAAEAQQFIDQQNDSAMLSIRDAIPRRCIDYCDYGKSGLCVHAPSTSIHTEELA